MIRRRQLLRIVSWPEVDERLASLQEMADRFGILIPCDEWDANGEPVLPRDEDGTILGYSLTHVPHTEALATLPEHEGIAEPIGWGGGEQKLNRLSEGRKRRIRKVRVVTDARAELEAAEPRAIDERMRDPELRPVVSERRSEVRALVDEMVADDGNPAHVRKRVQAEVEESDIVIGTGFLDDGSGGGGDAAPVPAVYLPTVKEEELVNG